MRRDRRFERNILYLNKRTKCRTIQISWYSFLFRKLTLVDRPKHADILKWTIVSMVCTFAPEIVEGKIECVYLGFLLLVLVTFPAILVISCRSPSKETLFACPASSTVKKVCRTPNYLKFLNLRANFIEKYYLIQYLNLFKIECWPQFPGLMMSISLCLIRFQEILQDASIQIMVLFSFLFSFFLTMEPMHRTVRGHRVEC